MDPRNLKRIQILVMNMAATLNACSPAQSAKAAQILHPSKQIFDFDSSFAIVVFSCLVSNEGVKTSQSKSVIRAKTAGDLVCSSQARQFQWTCSSSVPSVNGD